MDFFVILMDNEHLFNHRFVTEKQIMTRDCLISTLIYTYTLDNTVSHTAHNYSFTQIKPFQLIVNVVIMSMLCVLSKPFFTIASCLRHMNS